MEEDKIIYIWDYRFEKNGKTRRVNLGKTTKGEMEVESQCKAINSFIGIKKAKGVLCKIKKWIRLN